MTWWLTSLMFDHRNYLDGKCTYHNCGDRVGGVVSCLGYRAAGMDRGSYRDAHVLLRQLLRRLSTLGVLPQWRSRLREEELHVHERGSIDSR